MVECGMVSSEISDKLVCPRWWSIHLFSIIDYWFAINYQKKKKRTSSIKRLSSPNNRLWLNYSNRGFHVPSSWRISDRRRTVRNVVIIIIIYKTYIETHSLLLLPPDLFKRFNYFLSIAIYSSDDRLKFIVVIPIRKPHLPFLSFNFARMLHPS